MRRFVGCVAVVAVLAAVLTAADGSAHLRTIQGGSNVTTPGAWPWMVFIVGMNAGEGWVSACSGELIGPTTVLTAAHCFTPDPYDPITHYIVTPARTNSWINGTPPLQPPAPAESVSASAVVKDPGWNYNYPADHPFDDVGVIPLQTALPGTAWVPLIQPDEVSPFLSQSGFGGLTAGYGLTSPNGSTVGTLRQTVISSAVTDIGYGDPADNTGAWWEWQNQTATGTCEGDSGGPLLVPMGGGALPVSTDPSAGNGNWAVIGITHAGPAGACNQGVYENVAYHVAGSNDVASWLAPYETPWAYVDPTIPATVVEGSPVTCNSGVWAEDTATFTYAWSTLAGGVIGGADQKTYTPTSGDVGQSLQCGVTATVPGFGSTYTDWSLASTVLAPPPAVTVTGKVSSAKHTATFTLAPATGTADGVTYQCALAKRKTNGKYPAFTYATCASPQKYTHLKLGRYKFAAFAVTVAGNGNPTVKTFAIG